MILSAASAATSQNVTLRKPNTRRSGALGCGDCKQRLSTVMLGELGPIRERAEALRADPRRVLEVLNDGAARARAIAQQTMREVREAMGLGAAAP